MKCKACGKAVRFGKSVITKSGPVLFCDKQPKCKKAALELEKYEQSRKEKAA